VVREEGTRGRKKRKKSREEEKGEMK